MKEETLKILSKREALNNTQKIREETWEKDNVKLDINFEELEKETKIFLNRRMKYINVEEKEFESRKTMRL